MTPDPAGLATATPNGAAALDALRDIHLPDPVSFWPLAPGWWLLAAAVIALSVFVALRVRARRRSPERFALQIVDALAEGFARDGDRLALATGLSRLLRRVALARAERHEVAALHGTARAEALAPPGADADQSFELIAQLETWVYAGRDDASATGDPARWIDAARRLVGRPIRRKS